LEADGEDERGDDQKQDALENPKEREPHHRPDEGKTYLDPIRRRGPVVSPRLSLGDLRYSIPFLVHDPPFRSLRITAGKIPVDSSSQPVR
jgi:hypothetical protein